MNTKFGTHKDGESKGYGYVEFRSQTGIEAAALAALLPGDGFVLSGKYTDENTLLITSIPGSDEVVSEEPAPPYHTMKRPQLMTLCAEKGIKYEKTDRVADLVQKLKAHKGDD